MVLPNRIITLLSVVLLAMGWQACYYDVEEELYPFEPTNCDTLANTYTAKIEGIMTTNCAVSGCHTGVAPTAGLFLDTYQQAKAIADDGRLEMKVLIDRSMPPTGPLDDCDRLAIEQWIAAGAPEN